MSYICDRPSTFSGCYWANSTLPTMCKKFGVAELRYDNCGQRMFWLADLPRLSAIEMIRWI